MSLESLIFWLSVNLLWLAAVNAYFWRQAGKRLPERQPRSWTARFTSKLSLLLTLNAWLVGIVFYKLARELSGFAGANSPGEFLSWRGDEQSAYIALLLIAYLSPFLVIVSLPMATTGFVISRRKGDSLARQISVAAIGLSVALVVYGCVCWATDMAAR